METVITIWEREFKQGDWEHNHISTGYDPAVTIPAGTPEQTKSWSNGKWRGIMASLVDGKVTYA